MIGVINLDKPVGPTSHDMVALVRRLSGTRRIGHAGTLDPLASGVLPILVGQATRFSEDLTGSSKRYRAIIRLGERSATDDAEGPLARGNGPLPEVAVLPGVLASFVGTIEQRPPAFSARKHAGQTAYRAARSGAPLDLPPRSVRIDAIELIATTPGDGILDAEVDVRCGPGTYIRSLARDVGDALGCGAHLHALRRTEAAGLRIAEAIEPEALQALAADGRLAEAVLPITGLLRLPHVQLDAAGAERFRHGSVLSVGRDRPDGRHVVLHGELLLGIGVVSAGMLQPNKVLAEVSA